MFKNGGYTGLTIVIVGPTGSGKTGASIQLAQELNKKFIQNIDDGYLCEDIKLMNRSVGRGSMEAEIISADSRAIYKYMDVGTAKPSREEMDRVQHFGIDLVEPGERFTVADWKEYARQKILEIRSRGNVPIVVGGTGLYVDALVYDYKFTQEAKENCSDRSEIDSNYKIFGIKWTNEELRARLRKRVNKIFVQELFEETSFLVERYGWENQAMKSNIYDITWKYMRGAIGLEEAKELAFLEDWHLAKRQMTWFKRNENIEWIEPSKIVHKMLSCVII